MNNEINNIATFVKNVIDNTFDTLVRIYNGGKGVNGEFKGSRLIFPRYKKDGKDKRYNPAIYTGQNKDVREQEKDRFMTDSDCKVLLGTTGAMGTGLTLTAANTVIFLDEPWNRAIKDQCEDRVHRIGTKESPNIITIMCKGTIDERINDLVYKKGKNRENITRFINVLKKKVDK